MPYSRFSSTLAQSAPHSDISAPEPPTPAELGRGGEGPSPPRVALLLQQVPQTAMGRSLAVSAGSQTQAAQGWAGSALRLRALQRAGASFLLLTLDGWEALPFAPLLRLAAVQGCVAVQTAGG